MEKILSILIPTQHKRKMYLDQLVAEINRQLGDNYGKVEILTDYGTETTGEKRNRLLRAASGKYSWFIDDDDMIFEGTLNRLFEAAKKDVDTFGIIGLLTTNGANPEWFSISLAFPAWQKVNGVYFTYPNHISPIRTSLAKQILFPALTFGEDIKWSIAMHNSRLLKTEVCIGCCYHYKLRTNK